MKKRFTAALLTGAMLLSASVFPAASGFSDLNEFHKWAEPQIEEMTAIGIIKGYTDGTFRPDRAITKTEALVLTARAAGYITKDYDAFKEMAYERYGDIVSKYETPYNSEISFLLYKGVISEDELGEYISADRCDSPLLRYEMAILLTKLMRAEDSINKTSFKLSYSDAGEIPYSAAGYVEYATNAALMQGVYDPEYPNDIFFKPYSQVTRAQMAVLLCRMLKKFDISVEQYTVIGKTAVNNTITYRDETGKTTLYAVKDGVNLIVDGYNTDSVAPVQAGASMAFFSINGVVSDIEIINISSSRWDGNEGIYNVSVPTDPVEGVITTIVLGEDCSVVIGSSEYTLSAAAAIYVNHVASTVYDLRVGHTAKLEFADGKVIMIYATAPSDYSTQIVTTEGTVTKLSLTNRYMYIDVENTQSGTVSEKMMIIERGAVIFNGISGQSIDFSSLDIDDTVIVTGTIKDDGNFYASKIIVR